MINNAELNYFETCDSKILAVELVLLSPEAFFRKKLQGRTVLRKEICMIDALMKGSAPLCGLAPTIQPPP